MASYYKELTVKFPIKLIFFRLCLINYLRMGAANLDDVAELLCFGVDGVVQSLQVGQEGGVHFNSNRYVHGGGVGVV